MPRFFAHVAFLLLLLLAPPLQAQDDSGSGRDPDRIRSDDLGDKLDDRELRDDRDDDSRDHSGPGGHDSDRDDPESKEESENSGKSNDSDDDDIDDSDDDPDDDSDDDAVDVEDDSANNSASGALSAIEVDARGHERVNGELIAIASKDELASIRANGFEVVGAYPLPGQALTLAEIRLRAGLDEDAEASSLRRLLAGRIVEPHYVYRLAEGGAATTANTATAATPPRNVAGMVGMIDTGVDILHPALRGKLAGVQAFGGRHVTRTHGTQVAQILARHGVRVRVADVFQEDRHGQPVASAASIARALQWLAEQHAPVINVSLSGPHSGVVAQVVARVQRAGTIIVAATGNDGPAAPPAYPAALPGVLGVTAIDLRDRVYRRANRGDHVDYAAVGVDVPVAIGPRIERVTGTSYASPVISAALARRLASGSRTSAAAVADLQQQARDLGQPGRDPVFGWGAIEASTREENR